MEKLYEINVSGTPYYFGDLTTSSALSAHVSDTSIHQTSGEVEDMLTAYTYDKATIDEKVASGGTFDPANYYDKASTDALLDGKLDVNVFNVYSGVVASEMVNKAENIDLEALEGTFSAFSATIETVITSGGGVVSSSDCQTMIDNSISGKTNESDFSAHTADTTVHITADERTAWDAKPNVWIGDESSWSLISGSTENGVIYLVYE